MLDQFLRIFRESAADIQGKNRSGRVGGVTVSPELAQRERAISEFLADLSHSLRTPLTGILGFSDLMKNESRGPLGDPQYAAYVEQIRDDSSHMLDIVDDLLAMSRLDFDDDAGDHPPTDVNAAVQAAVRTVSPDDRADGGRIIVQLDKDLPLLRVGEADLRKMLHNLTDNALKYRRDEGLATVSVRVDFRGELVITVSDNGIGMLGSEVAMALSRYGRVDNRAGRITSGATAGAGLGLVGMRERALLSGGSLDAGPRPGCGFQVVAQLPIEDESP